MKRIRINNDFTFAWAIERNGLAENLSVAINKRLWIRNSTGTEVEINDYTIAGNIISVEVTPILAPIMGRYAFKFQYELPDLGLSDYERLCEVDVDSFIIVPRTAEADDSEDLLVVSDMAIGFKGDAFKYDDFTPEQLESLKVKGDPFTYDDFTPEQIAILKGEKGDPFLYSDLTPEQKAELKGADGKSAYEIWLLLGNQGTEQDFIDSLAAGGVDLTSYLKITDAANTYQPKGTYLENETDPSVPEWAKQVSKPAYGVNEITGLETALLGKVNNGRVLTDVPANAKFTDTVYTHPATHSISEVSGLQGALDGKVDDSQVLTNVPAEAVFTDTITTINGKTGTILKADIVALGIPDADTNTTYSEITTAEIDTGTASTLRTITARRLKYLLDKIVALFPTKTSELTNDSGFLTSVSKADVGLGNVDNTSDLNKPISTATQTALSGKVDSSRVLTDVPLNAKFTDTVYSHPANHPASIITQNASNRFVTDTEKSTWNAKQEALGFTAENVSNKKTTLTNSDTDYPTTKAVNTGLAGKANTTHTHDDRYYTESEVNTLLAAKKGAYDAEKVTSPASGTLTLKNSTETVLDGSLTSSNVFTVALPTPTAGQVNESILIFKIGASLPTITQPTGIVWRGATPTLAINTNWTIVYEQVNTTGTTYEIWAVATKNA